MKISNRNIYILGIATVLLIIVIVLPLLHLIRESSQELFSLEKELVLLQQKEKRSEDLQKKYELYRENLAKIDNFFVDSSFPIEFIKFLETAIDSQAEIKISLGREVTSPEPFLAFNISFSGSSRNLLKFIDKLRNGPYLIEIINLNIKSLGQESLGNVMANLELAVLTK